jgi:hypothetical protein
MTFANPNSYTGSGPLGFIGIQAWSEDKKAEIIRSRVEGTTELVEAMKKCGSKGPKTLVLQNKSSSCLTSFNGCRHALLAADVHRGVFVAGVRIWCGLLRIRYC